MQKVMRKVLEDRVDVLNFMDEELERGKGTWAAIGYHCKKRTTSKKWLKQRAKKFVKVIVRPLWKKGHKSIWSIQKENMEKNRKNSWAEHITKEKLLTRIDDIQILVETTRKRQSQWIGHILRRNSTTTKTLECLKTWKTKRMTKNHVA